MSFFEAPDTGIKYFIFGDGGAKREAEKIGIDFLGQIPLDIAIREKSDEGNPIYAHDKDHPQSKIYRDIANQVWKKISDTSKSFLYLALLLKIQRTHKLIPLTSTDTAALLRYFFSLYELLDNLLPRFRNYNCPKLMLAKGFVGNRGPSF